MTFPPVFTPPNADSVATVTHTANAVSTTDLTTYTFSSQSIGTASATRKVVVGVVISGGAVGQIDVSTLTVGGNSASLVVKGQGSTEHSVELWQVDVSSGATADVVVTADQAVDRCGIDVWAVYGAAASAHDTGSSTVDPMTDTLNIPANGVALGEALANGSSTFTWTNLDEDSDETVETTTSHSGASKAFAAQQTGLSITATPSAATGTNTFAIASWGPA